MFKKLIIALVAVLLLTSVVGFAFTSSKKSNKISINTDNAIKSADQFKCNTGARMGVKNSKLFNFSRLIPNSNTYAKQNAGQCYCPTYLIIDSIKLPGGLESSPMQINESGILADDKTMCAVLTRDFIRSKTPCVPKCPEGKTCNKNAGVEPMCLQAKAKTKSTALILNKQKSARII
jgi:hypothetical protein